ncbi:MAG: tRNA lysidine(34) synthetase TilS [Armatimonadota bacterium]|jgi:tRNA(Ile)-lysidine synthase
MNAELVERAEEAIGRFGLLSGGESVVVGVSGGQDSVALLDVLRQLAPAMRLRLAVAHLHHGVRGADADGDEAVSGRLAEDAGVPFRSRRLDVPTLARESGRSLEEAGREARYEFFEAVRDELGADVVALGHTASDRAETLLMNLLRGAGLDGLGSIPPRRGCIVRPLILATRQETLAHCRRNELGFRIDHTNLAPQHLRNKVRLELLPLLEREYARGAGSHIARAAELAHEDAQLLGELAVDALDDASIDTSTGDVTLELARLSSMPEALARRVLREAVRLTSGDLRDLQYKHIRDTVRLIKGGRTGGRVALPGGVAVERGYGELRISRGRPEAPSAEYVEASLPVPGEVTVAELRVQVRGELWEAEGAAIAGGKWRATVDATGAGNALVVRNWRPGDRFRPLGLGGAKKLQDFFVDAKVPRAERSRVPIVARADGQIVWVVGHRLDERAKVLPSTTRVLALTASAL